MDESFLLFILIGFGAQLIDGALGMAYGVISTTSMLSMGYSPVIASASVHTAELVTTLSSGISHLSMKNIHIKLFRNLVLPGAVGAVAGAYLLTCIPGTIIKPFITLYLFIMGFIILRRALKRSYNRLETTKTTAVGLAGGFCDAIGGGGWGPIVTSTMLGRGENPRFVIGSVNCCEFFITAAQAATFFCTVKLTHWQAIIGLSLGGVVAAPLAALVCSKVPARQLMFLVGILILLVNGWALLLLFR